MSAGTHCAPTVDPFLAVLDSQCEALWITLRAEYIRASSSASCPREVVASDPFRQVPAEDVGVTSATSSGSFQRDPAEGAKEVNMQVEKALATQDSEFLRVIMPEPQAALVQAPTGSQPLRPQEEPPRLTSSRTGSKNSFLVEAPSRAANAGPSADEMAVEAEDLGPLLPGSARTSAISEMRRSIAASAHLGEDIARERGASIMVESVRSVRFSEGSLAPRFRDSTMSAPDGDAVIPMITDFTEGQASTNPSLNGKGGGMSSAGRMSDMTKSSSSLADLDEGFTLHERWAETKRIWTGNMRRRSKTSGDPTAKTRSSISANALLQDAGKSRKRTSRWVPAYDPEHRGMIFPYSTQHILWEIAALVLVMYDTITLPLDFFNPPATDLSDFMAWLIRVYWTFDMVVSFRTGYVDNRGTVVMDPCLVAKRYFKRQAHLDFLVVLADWLALLGSERYTTLLRNLRIFRVARVLRLKKAREIFARLAEFTRAEKLVLAAGIVKALSFFLVALHLLSCAWYGVGDFGMRMEMDNWVDYHGLKSASLADRYLASFHFAVAIFYGEHIMMPRNTYERAFTVIVLYCSFVAQIWLVSSITTAMTHLEIVSAKRSQLVYTLDRYLNTHSVSRELELKVQRSAKHALRQRELNNEEDNVELLTLISDPLLMELRTEIHDPILCIHPLFRCIGAANPLCIRRVCHTAVSVHAFHKGDIVFNFQETPSFGSSSKAAGGSPSLLFITHGEFEYILPEMVDVESPSGSIELKPVILSGAARVLTLKKGHWLSEAVLWTGDWVHCGTLRANSPNCRLLAVDADKAQAVLTSWQDMKVRTYAELYLESLNEMGMNEHTDVGVYDDEVAQNMARIFPHEWAQVREEYDYVKMLARAKTNGRLGSVTGSMTTQRLKNTPKTLLNAASAALGITRASRFSTRRWASVG